MDIAIRDLRHVYASPASGDRTVLRIDRWTVASGEQWLLHGVSGSGKTTLLEVLAGLLPPTSGVVELDGTSLYADSEMERDRRRATSIGAVHQTHLLVPILSALENVEMPLVYARRGSQSERRGRAREALARVGLGDFERHRPGQLSMGQRLRVAIARALVIEPRLVLADEPTAALDPEGARDVIDVLLAYSREHGASLVVASHDPSLDDQFADRATLSEGRLVPVLGIVPAVGFVPAVA